MNEGAKMYGCLFQLVVSIGAWVAAFGVYDTKSAFLVMLVLGPLLMLSALLGLVPLFGPYLYWKAAKAWVLVSFFEWFADVHATWFTSLLFWSSFVVSLMLTLFSTLGVLAAARS